jgi:uncharacterized membrane-anchored protein YhcB (DUF1043 family)
MEQPDASAGTDAPSLTATILDGSSRLATIVPAGDLHFVEGGEMIDWTISVSTIIAGAGMAISAIVGFVVLRLQVAALKEDFEAHVKSNEDDFADHAKSIDNHRAELASNLSAIVAKLDYNHARMMETHETNARETAAAFHAFEVKVAENYAGNTALEKAEARLVKAIEDLRRSVDGLSRVRNELSSR